MPALGAAIYKKVRSLTPDFRKKRFSCFGGQITHTREKPVLSMFAPHFRGRMDPPKKSPNWKPAYINDRALV